MNKEKGKKGFGKTQCQGKGNSMHKCSLITKVLMWMNILHNLT
jgi:hypothetical protein